MADAQPDTQNWASVSLGIVTTATILAAATSAGIFAVSSGLFGSAKGGYPEWLKELSAFLAIISLLSYGAVLVFGLAAPFLRPEEAQRGEALKSAAALYTQAFSAIIAAVLIIFAQLL